MSTESLHNEPQPVLAGSAEIYGARILSAAVGLKTGDHKFMVIQRRSGYPEVVTQTGAANLIQETLSQFAIQKLVRYELPQKVAEDRIDTTETMNG